MATIYVADSRARELLPVPREVLSKPGAKYLRIDARPLGIRDRQDAYFMPTLGREVWPKNKGILWSGERLFAYATRQEFDDRIESRRRTEALIETLRLSLIDRAIRPSLDQLRQACAHLGVTYDKA